MNTDTTTEVGLRAGGRWSIGLLNSGETIPSQREGTHGLPAVDPTGRPNPLRRLGLRRLPERLARGNLLTGTRWTDCTSAA